MMEVSEADVVEDEVDLVVVVVVEIGVAMVEIGVAMVAEMVVVVVVLAEVVTEEATGEEEDVVVTEVDLDEVETGEAEMTDGPGPIRCHEDVPCSPVLSSLKLPHVFIPYFHIIHSSIDGLISSLSSTHCSQ